MKYPFSNFFGSEDEGYATLVLLDDNSNNLAVVEMGKNKMIKIANTIRKDIYQEWNKLKYFFFFAFKDAKGKQNQFRSATKIEIPVSFIVYENLNRGSELYLRLKTNKYRESSSDPNLLSGQLQTEQVKILNNNPIGNNAYYLHVFSLSDIQLFLAIGDQSFNNYLCKNLWHQNSWSNKRFVFRGKLLQVCK